MKHGITFLASVILIQFAWCGEVVPIQQFGENGSKAPTFLCDRLNPEFFAQSQMAALADGRNFITSWQLPNHSQDESKVETQLFVANFGENTAQIVVSAEEGTRIRNFLVPVAPGDEVGLDVSSLTRFDRVFLISVEPFSAVAVSQSLDSGPDYTDLVVQEPRAGFEPAVLEKSTNYCSEQFQKPITMWGYDSVTQNWNSVSAWADRFNLSGTFYWIQVHYPVYGMVFHNESGSFNQTEACKSSIHTTYSNATGKSLSWSGMADLMTGVTTSATAVNFSDPSEIWYIFP